MRPSVRALNLRHAILQMRVIERFAYVMRSRRR